MQGAHAPALQLLLERRGYTYYRCGYTDYGYSYYGYSYYGYTYYGHTYYGHTYYGALQLLLERQGDRYVNPNLSSLQPYVSRQGYRDVRLSGGAASRRLSPKGKALATLTPNPNPDHGPYPNPNQARPSPL